MRGPVNDFRRRVGVPPVSSSYLTGTVALMKEAGRMAGCRAIIQAEVPPERSDRLMVVSRTPHAQLFPRCAAVVHHCGAGTTHTTLKAGVPSVAVPHVPDQFPWAGELQRLGVAPPAVTRRTLTAAKLARRITEVLANPDMRANAAAFSARMTDDNGPARAAELIEDAMQRLAAPKLGGRTRAKAGA